MRLLYTAALIVSFAVPAAAQPTQVGAAPGRVGATSALPSESALAGLRNFSQWSAKGESASLLAGRGSLAAFSKLNFNDEIQRRALAPLVERLGERLRDRLARIAELPA